jgi:hypothetical protein
MAFNNLVCIVFRGGGWMLRNLTRLLLFCYKTVNKGSQTVELSQILVVVTHIYYWPTRICPVFKLRKEATVCSSRYVEWWANKRKFNFGRAVAQAFSRWLLTAAARARAGQHVLIVVDKTALGQVFSEYFGFPWQSFHQFLHHNHPEVAQ